MSVILHGFMANLAVVAIVISLWPYVFERTQRLDRRLQGALFGVFMGAGAIGTMLLTVPLIEGVFFDFRNVMLALAALFGGPVAALISLCIGLAYRVSMGGAGMVAGSVGIIIPSMIGLAGFLLLRGRAPERSDVMVLALATAIGSLPSLWFLPEALRQTALQTVSLPRGILVFIAVSIAGLAMVQERRRRIALRENLIYRSTILALPDSLNVKDLEGRFISANPATAKLVGVPSVEHLIGRTDADFNVPDTALQYRRDELAVLQANKPSVIEQRLDRDGQTMWLSTLKVPLHDEHGQLIGIVTHNRDVTERKRLEQELEHNRAQLSFALTEMSDGLAVFDRHGCLVFCNAQYRTLFPRTSELRVPGVHIRTILAAAIETGEQRPDGTLAPEQWIDRIADNLFKDMEEETYICDGRWLRIVTRPTANGQSLVVVSDITRLKETELELIAKGEQLLQDATTDPLTGLMNRRVLDETMAREIGRSARADTPISIVMLDIDRFKSYNDSYGHMAGDECLVAVSQCFANCFKRPGDLVARYGGEEFIAVLPETDDDGAYHLARAFREALADLNLPHAVARKGRVTASIGIASYLPGDQDRSPEQLFLQADKALYDAKAAGRDRINGWRRHYFRDTGIAS